MERRLRREEVMTIEVLHERGVSNRAIARQLGVHEHAVRYRLQRLASGARGRPGGQGVARRSRGRRRSRTGCATARRSAGVNLAGALRVAAWPSTATRGATRRCSASCGRSTRSRGCGCGGGWRRRRARRRRPTGRSFRGARGRARRVDAARLPPRALALARRGGGVVGARRTSSAWLAVHNGGARAASAACRRWCASTTRRRRSRRARGPGA